MDAAVDGILGERILYKRVGETEFTEIPAFIVERNAPLDLGEIDETQDNTKRIKVSRELVPHVSERDRVRHPRLGASTFRPLGKVPDTDGRYWIFDVQETSL